MNNLLKNTLLVLLPLVTLASCKSGQALTKGSDLGGTDGCIIDIQPRTRIAGGAEYTVPFYAESLDGEYVGTRFTVFAPIEDAFELFKTKNGPAYKLEIKAKTVYVIELGEPASGNSSPPKARLRVMEAGQGWLDLDDDFGVETSWKEGREYRDPKLVRLSSSLSNRGYIIKYQAYGAKMKLYVKTRVRNSF
jgi:hypothetical protein